MKIIAISQARYASTRLPGKILKEICGTSMLRTHLQRIKQSSLISDIILSTSQNKEDDATESDVKEERGIHCFRGSENNVLDRFYQASLQFKPAYIVRLTGDCPLIDPALIDDVVKFTIDNKLDYANNTLEEKYPDGQDIEVFTFAALELAWKEAKSKTEQEHVTPYIVENSSFKGGSIFSAMCYPAKEDYGHLRMTVDQIEDLKLVEILIDKLGSNKKWECYVEYIQKNPELAELNSHISRNEGLKKSLLEDKNN